MAAELPSTKGGEAQVPPFKKGGPGGISDPRELLLSTDRPPYLSLLSCPLIFRAGMPKTPSEMCGVDFALILQGVPVQSAFYCNFLHSNLWK